MLSKNQSKAYTEFYNSTSNSEILDSKTTLIIQLATAMAVGCYP
jgi:hypothetical protein